LPDVDDGAKDVEESLKMLEMMKTQGITDVFATPHFDASQYDIEEFNYVIDSSKKSLEESIKGLDLPKIYIGCEVYYFSGIGRISGIKSLCLNNSNYILLELRYGHPITDQVLRDISDIYNKYGIVPIIAHIERYAKEKGFKQLLGLIGGRTCLAQINATSLMDKNPFRKTSLKLIKKGFISFIATDAHSPQMRPPLMSQALEVVKENLGKEYVDTILHNFEIFHDNVLAPKNNI
ncbi:MAG: hypothetical protein J6D52_01835, partial [Clostridia bacterium]|nr:hypothetical protein [Clostridia bacterium]